MKEFTIYHTRITKTQWPGPIVEGIRRYYTGTVHHVIQVEHPPEDPADQESVYIGKSVCSKKDQFNKKVARNIARGRADICRKLVEKGAIMPTARINVNGDIIEGYGYCHMDGYRAKYKVIGNGSKWRRRNRTSIET